MTTNVKNNYMTLDTRHGEKFEGNVDRTTLTEN